MSVTVREEPRLLHALPGRIRVHLPQWRGDGQRGIERRLRALPGVRSVQATPLTGNVLIRFAPAATNVQALLAALRAVESALHAVEEGAAEPERAVPFSTAGVQAPRVLQDRRGPTRRARLAVRGLDRDPHLSRRVVDRLEHYPGVQARANPLTGRVLV